MSRNVAIVLATAASLLGPLTTLWTLFGPTYHYVRLPPIVAPAGESSELVERGTLSLLEVGLSLPAAILIGVLTTASVVGLIGAWWIRRGRVPLAAQAMAVASGILWGGSLISLWGIGLSYLPTAAQMSIASLTASQAARQRFSRGLLLILLSLLGTLFILVAAINAVR